MSYAEFVERALYDPDRGFYTAGGGSAGRGGDFLTSPEVGPLFGAVVAGALDSCWEAIGRPDPFTVVEAAAGTGALARSILAHRPLACRDALRYVAVERSPARRAGLAEIGPPVEVVDALPPGPLAGMVLANELLDNLPFDLFEYGGDGTWHEIRPVPTGDGAWRETTRAAERAVGAELDQLVPTPAPGVRVPRQVAAAAWVSAARSILDRGRVVAFDYGDSTASMAARPVADWLRTYRRHARGGPPLDAPGTQDITCEVALDQLAAAAAPVRQQRQAEWLRSHGIDRLVEDGKRIWHERAHLGDLEAIRGRSRVIEAEALCDPDGLGAFWVLEWRPGGDR